MRDGILGSICLARHVPSTVVREGNDSGTRCKVATDEGCSIDVVVAGWVKVSVLCPVCVRTTVTMDVCILMGSESCL